MKELSFSHKETLTHLIHCEIVGQFGFSFVRSMFFFVFVGLSFSHSNIAQYSEYKVTLFEVYRQRRWRRPWQQQQPY